jgi:hypothetical protein
LIGASNQKEKQNMFDVFQKHAPWVALAAAVFLAAPAIQVNAQSSDDIRAIAEEAYVFAYPMTEIQIV